MGMHAEDLPGFEWMTDKPSITVSTVDEWNGYYERKAREAFKAEISLRQDNAILIGMVSRLEKQNERRIKLETICKEFIDRTQKGRTRSKHIFTELTKYFDEGC